MVSKQLARALLLFLFVSCVAGAYLAIEMRVPRGVPAGGGLSLAFIGGQSHPNIAIVPVQGVISAGSGSALAGRSSIDDLLGRFRRLERDDCVKAVVVRINSPGGSVGSVQELYAAVRRLRSAGKKVVASIGDIGASGGYYIAAGCDRIVSNPGAITGSIGVIMEVGNVQELFTKIGVRVVAVKSGAYKDIGSPVRELTDEERRIFQSLIDSAYAQFVDAIVEGRGMSRDDVLRAADGRVFTGEQAKAAGLIDEFGGLAEAITRAGELAGIAQDDIRISYPTNSFRLLLRMLQSRAGLLSMLNLPGVIRDSGPRLEYRVQ